MAKISLTLPVCWPLQIALADKPAPEVSCLGVDDLVPAEVKPGGRTLLVTPYDPNGTGNKICSGQYGQWQVLTGLGGQINRGIYAGQSFKKDPASYGAPGVSSEIDTNDCCNPGDKCIAIRDRGRWYVSKLGGGGGTVTKGEGIAIGVVLGGNVLPKIISATTPALTAPVQRDTYPSPDDTVNEYGYKDSDFPDRRPFGYSLPVTDTVGNKLAAPIINDWRKYLLPDTYVMGGKLPRIPDGLCYVRVERPYKMADGTVWNANDTGAPPRPGVGDQLPVKGSQSDTTITVWYRYANNQGIPAGAAGDAVWGISPALAAATTPDAVAALFTLTSNGSPLVVTGWTIVIGAATFNPDGSLVLSLYKAKTGFATIPATSEDVSATNAPGLAVNVPAGTIQVTLDPVPPATVGVVVPAGGALVLTPTAHDNSVVIICLNDSSRQGFRAGDLVYIADSVLKLQDRYGIVNNGVNQSHNVFRIVGGISGVKSNITGI